MTGHTPNPLARHYSRFRVGERLLLTGHSHQAWPDVGFEAQQRAWLDAAEYVDGKWEKAEVQAARVRAGFARLLDDRAENIALGQNTHELVTRWLSALPLRERPRLVTTDGEFHSLRRQVDRLAEAGLETVNVPATPVDTLADRLAATLDSRTGCVMVSSVLFETAAIVPGLDRLAAACRRDGVPLLLDAYHQLNVVPFDLGAGLEDVFVTGGGYKYCQLGEGNCFLRVPAACELRPMFTGWFSEFAELAASRSEHEVTYGAGAARFAGATYDPTAHYRADAVFRFHRDMNLTAARLRAISQEQTSALADGIEALDLDPEMAGVIKVAADRRAGFVAIRAAQATSLVRGLRRHGVWADARGQTLRLGPAPYVSGDQLRAATAALGAIVRQEGAESNRLK